MNKELKEARYSFELEETKKQIKSLIDLVESCYQLDKTKSELISHIQECSWTKQKEIGYDNSYIEIIDSIYRNKESLFKHSNVSMISLCVHISNILPKYSLEKIQDVVLTSNRFMIFYDHNNKQFVCLK